MTAQPVSDLDWRHGVDRCIHCSWSSPTDVFPGSHEEKDGDTLNDFDTLQGDVWKAERREVR